MRQAIHDVPVDVVQAAMLVARNAPDPRKDRVALAIVHLGAGALDSNTVAQAVISTIIADCER